MTRAAKNIIVVDSSPEFLTQSVQAIKQNDPVEVNTFPDTESAYALLQKNQDIEVVITDIVLQSSASLDLLKQIRKLPEPPEIILTCAHATIENVIMALQNGAADYIVKPISDWTVVIQSLNRASERFRLRKQNKELLSELALRNAELSHSVSLLRVLTDVTVRMHRSASNEEILNILVRTVANTLSAKRVSLMVLDKESRQLSIRVAVGIPSEVIDEVHMSADEGVVGQVLATQQPLIVENASSDERLPEHHQRKGKYHGSAFMSAPIFIGEKAGQSPQVMGVINISERTGDRPFRPGETEFVLYLARQAALALESAGAMYALKHNTSKSM